MLTHARNKLDHLETNPTKNSSLVRGSGWALPSYTNSSHPPLIEYFGGRNYKYGTSPIEVSMNPTNFSLNRM
jgi:hypothetical protein